MQKGGAPPAAKTNQTQDPTDMTQRVLEIDTEIDKEQTNIDEHRSLINMTYLDLWQIEKGGPATSRGGISQNGPVDVEHEIIRLQGDIAAIEKDITSRRRRIKI